MSLARAVAHGNAPAATKPAATIALRITSSSGFRGRNLPPQPRSGQIPRARHELMRRRTVRTGGLDPSEDRLLMSIRGTGSRLPFVPLVLGAILLSGARPAPRHGEIEVRVVTAGGRPVEGARVVLAASGRDREIG